MNPIEELEVLSAIGETVTLSTKEQVEVRPYTFLQFAKALKHITSMTDVMQGDNLDILRAFAEHADSVVDLIQLATGKSINWFESLMMDDGIELAMATYRVNSDFFERKVMPKLKGFLPSQNSPEQPIQSAEDLQPEVLETAGSESSSS